MISREGFEGEAEGAKPSRKAQNVCNLVVTSRICILLRSSYKTVN